MSTRRPKEYAGSVPISRAPGDRLRPIPHLGELDGFVGKWVAVKGDKVIAASDSSRDLAYQLQKMGSRADGAVTEYVRPGREDAYIVGVG
jgi:hypothetical protein